MLRNGGAMKNLPIPRLDKQPELHKHLLKYCRLGRGEIWEDPQGRHKVGCLDAANRSDIEQLMCGEQASLAIQDPPYNIVAFEQRAINDYIAWSEQWVANTDAALTPDSSLYV